MEPDQLLFKKIINLFKRFKKTDPDVVDRTATLDVLIGRLTLIATALSGTKIDVLPAEMEGGSKAGLFYLPVSFALLPSLDDNIKYYLYRTVYHSIQINFDIEIPQGDISLEEFRNLNKTYADQIVKVMETDYPSVAEYYHSIKDLFEPETKDSTKIPDYWLYGKFMITKSDAKKLVKIANKIRNLKELGLMETVSTRLVVDAAKLMHSGLAKRLSVEVGMIQPLTDDDEILEALKDLADLMI